MTKKQTYRIPCDKCEGLGVLELSDDMKKTLMEVRMLVAATADQVKSALRWKGTRAAINKRLEELREYGFLRRERQGKEFFYSINKV